MVNRDMTVTLYSTNPQIVSRYLGTQGFTRSRRARGRLTDYATTGFTVRRVLGETQVGFTVDVREVRPRSEVERRMRELAKALKKRYAVVRRGRVLVVSENVLRPEGLSFTKRAGVLGTRYVAETEKHRYVIQRDTKAPAKFAWELRVFSLKPVGQLDSMMIVDECVFHIQDSTKADMVEEAHLYLKNHS